VDVSRTDSCLYSFSVSAKRFDNGTYGTPHRQVLPVGYRKESAKESADVIPLAMATYSSLGIITFTWLMSISSYSNTTRRLNSFQRMYALPRALRCITGRCTYRSMVPFIHPFECRHVTAVFQASTHVNHEGKRRRQRIHNLRDRITLELRMREFQKRRSTTVKAIQYRQMQRNPANRD